MNNIYRFQTLEKAISDVIKRWQAIAHDAIDSSGQFNVALSGGTSPVALYQALAHAKQLPWVSTHLFLVDERFVPDTDVNSNYRMIKQSLIDHVPLTAQQIHPIRIMETPKASAQAYEKMLRQHFNLKTHAIFSFDLIVLGLGEDGHTASLFTDKDCDEKGKMVIHTHSPKPPTDRITLTLPVLNHGKNIVFFISGQHKQRILTKVFEEKIAHYPASKVESLLGKPNVVYSYSKQ